MTRYSSKISIAALLLSLVTAGGPWSAGPVANAQRLGGNTMAQAGSAHGDARLAGLTHWWRLKRGHPSGAALAAARAKANLLPHSNRLPSATVVAGSGMIKRHDLPTKAWTSIGPAPIGGTAPDGGKWGFSSGRVAAIALDPTTAGANQVIYLGTASGGVWKSSDNGGSWAPLTDNQPALSTGAITVDPNSHNTIYVGTGEANVGNLQGDGVLKSTDAGATWTQQGGGTGGVFGKRSSSFFKIVVNPRNSQQVFAATNRGLFQTNDGGTTWTQNTGTGFPTGTVSISDIGIDPSNTDPAKLVLHAAVRGNGLYKSVDDGATWTPEGVGTLPAAADWNRSALAVSPSNPQTVYLVIVNGSGHNYAAGSYNGGYYTTDGGMTWHPMASLNQDFAQGQGGYDLVLTVDPLNSNIVYGAGVYDASTQDAQATTGNWVLDQGGASIPHPDV
ncbi:MAG TPA: hypothetical protein VG815_15985, partial [Chloroflexota bacterium]|nr:hypothetical protein [Chloroflexota bacterium]